MKRFFLLTQSSQHFAVQARDVYYQGDLAPLNITPTFEEGYFRYTSPNLQLSIRARGSLAYKVTPQVAAAKWINVVNAAPDSDGNLAIFVEYRMEKSHAGGLAVFDPAGNQTAFIDTGVSWWPTHICFGPDHSIWAVGWRGLDAPIASPADYFVLRNYALDGRLLGSFLPRASFEQDPVDPNVGAWQLRSANDRIGGLYYTTAVLPKGTAGRMGEWIETDLEGNVVRRVDMPQKTIAAFANNGSVYAREYLAGYTALNPALNSWRTISPAVHGALLGADDNSLVFLIPGMNRV